jgi:hypothetical protein
MVEGEIKTEERELRMKKGREWKRISMLGEGRKRRLNSENKTHKEVKTKRLYEREEEGGKGV